MERPNYNHSYEEFSMSTTESTIKVPLAIFAVVVLVWGIMGFLDIGKATQVGYDTDGNNTVTQVYSGGPAEAAGLEVGDFIVIPPKMPKRCSNWGAPRSARAEPGS
jgi:predicted metalloprotease with PDZ domain